MALLRSGLRRSRARIVAAGVADPGYADRVEAYLERHRAYLDAVAPTPFLDDTTTKNVLIADGTLSGIVDVDYLCFGDPLLTVALTRMALLARGWDTDYIDYWCAALARAAPRPILDLYTARISRSISWPNSGTPIIALSPRRSMRRISPIWKG